MMDSKVNKDGDKKGKVKLQMAVADLWEGEGYPLSYWHNFKYYTPGRLLVIPPPPHPHPTPPPNNKKYCNNPELREDLRVTYY